MAILVFRTLHFYRSYRVCILSFSQNGQSRCMATLGLCAGFRNSMFTNLYPFSAQKNPSIFRLKQPTVRMTNCFEKSTLSFKEVEMISEALAVKTDKVPTPCG